jgi:hypothetical protein
MLAAQVVVEHQTVAVAVAVLGLLVRLLLELLAVQAELGTTFRRSSLVVHCSSVVVVVVVELLVVLVVAVSVVLVAAVRLAGLLPQILHRVAVAVVLLPMAAPVVLALSM